MLRYTMILTPIDGNPHAQCYTKRNIKHASAAMFQLKRKELARNNVPSIFTLVTYEYISIVNFVIILHIIKY